MRGQYKDAFVVIVGFCGGMRKFKPVNGNKFLLTDRFEDDYPLIAEHKLRPNVSVKY